MTISNIIYGIAMLVAGALVSYGFNRLGKNRDTKSADEKENLESAKKAVVKRDEQIQELQRQMAVLQAESIPVQAAFQAMLIAKLTHLHTPRVDELLKKLGPPVMISDEEMAELRAALEERIVAVDARIDKEERIAAKILLDVAMLNRIEDDRQHAAKTEMILVTQPVVEEP